MRTARASKLSLMAAAVESCVSSATESRGFHVVGRIARFERRTIEDHFGNRLVELARP